MNNKTKLLLAGIFATLILWGVTGISPLQLLVTFVVAGSLPGIDSQVSPYAMFTLALLSGSLLIFLVRADRRANRQVITSKTSATHPKKARPRRATARTTSSPRQAASLATLPYTLHKHTRQYVKLLNRYLAERRTAWQNTPSK